MTPSRRAMILAGLGATALGGAVAVWKRPSSDASHPLYASRFAAPDGGDDLVMASFLGRPLLLNFWGTWCPPCVREMPLLDSFQRRQGSRGWQVVGLAVDAPSAVREFLRSRSLAFAVGMAGFEGMALSRSLGNESGALPFSALFDADGQLRGTHLGEFDAAALERATREIH